MLSLGHRWVQWRGATLITVGNAVMDWRFRRQAHRLLVPLGEHPPFPDPRDADLRLRGEQLNWKRRRAMRPPSPQL